MSETLDSVDLTAAPFNLTDAKRAWVEQALAGMTIEQKVGQTMCLYLRTDHVVPWIQSLAKRGIEPGGILLLPRSRSRAKDDITALQKKSVVPLLVAANLESGSVNFLSGTEAFATPMQVAATGDAAHAERLAIHCARIAQDIGINWAFAPVIDVTIDAHNPITNTRAFGRDPEQVALMGETYIRALEQRGIATSPKHFPGDGVDDRDQHLTTTSNDLTVEEWATTFEPVYHRTLAAGARSVMVGHIRQPALSRELVPGIAPTDILPASLAPELVGGVLRGRLRFNGLIVTDNSAMTGMTTVMPREAALPQTINAGCDMILGNIDVDHDFGILVNAVKSGKIPVRRLDHAVLRILAMKASLRLHEVHDDRDREPTNKDEEDVWRRELADSSITLVKDTQSLLPLSPDKHRRVVVFVLGDEPTFYDPSGPFAGKFVAGLRQRGLYVDVKHIPGENRSIQEMHQLHEKYDLCIYFANVKFVGNSNTLRVAFTPPQGPDAPRHVVTLPTVLVSIADPYLLQDMPMIRTVINGYTPSTATVDACLAKIFGESQFLGKSPIDPTAGHWDALL